MLPYSLHPLLLPCALILVCFFAGRAIGSFHLRRETQIDERYKLDSLGSFTARLVFA